MSEASEEYNLAKRHELEYMVLAGSYMYGTNTPLSDKDYRGFFVPTKEDFFGFKHPKDSVVMTDGTIDVAFWSIQKYFKLCANANPNVLETLFAEEPVYCSGIAHHVRTIKNSFLSRKIGKTYLGYAISNYHRVLTHRDPKNAFSYDGNDAMHLIRLARTGNEALRTGRLRVRREEDRDFFLRIKTNQEPWWGLETEFLAHQENWHKIVENSPLPTEVDEEALNKTLVRLVEYHFNVYQKER